MSTDSSVIAKKVEKESGIEKLQVESKNKNGVMQAKQQVAYQAEHETVQQIKQQAQDEDEFMAMYFRAFQELKKAEAMTVKFYSKIEALRNMTRMYLPTFKKDTLQSTIESETDTSRNKFTQEILKMNNLYMVRKELIENNMRNSEYLLKLFYPKLYAKLDRGPKFDAWLPIFIKRMLHAHNASIKIMNLCLEIIGDKLNSKEKNIESIYDSLHECKQAAELEKSWVRESLVEKFGVDFLVIFNEEDIYLHQTILIGVVDKLLSFIDPLVSDELRIYWKYVELKECTLKDMPYGRHVKISVYSEEVTEFYLKLMLKIANKRKLFDNPEIQKILDQTEQETQKIATELQELSQERIRKMLKEKPSQGHLKASGLFLDPRKFSDRDETRQTFYKLHQCYERYKSLSIQLDIQLKVAMANMALISDKAVVVKDKVVANVANRDKVATQDKAVERAAVVAIAGRETLVKTIRHTDTTMPAEVEEFKKNQDIEEYKKTQQKAIDDYKKQIQESRLRKQEARKKFINELQQEPKINTISMNKLRRGLSELDQDELSLIRRILEQCEVADQDSLEKVLLKLGFKSKPTESGISFRLDESSFSYHRVQAEKQRSGKPDVPWEALGKLRKIFWEHGITKEYLDVLSYKQDKQQAKFEQSQKEVPVKGKAGKKEKRKIA